MAFTSTRPPRARHHLALTLLALAGLLVAACGGTSSRATSGPTTTLVTATDISAIVTLDPNQSYENLSYDHDMYSTLVTFNKGDTTRVVPSVAKSWSTSPDGMSWTFHLRRGITFAGGDQLTASDFLYSIQRVVNLPKNPAAWLVTQMGITSSNVTQQVTAPDPSTVQIKLTQPVAPGAFLDIMAFPTTAVVDSKVVKEHESNGDWGHAWLDDHSAGSGPFMLGSWARGSQIVLSANPRYDLGPRPPLTRAVFQNVADSSAQYDLLQKGHTDVANGLTFQQMKQLSGNSKYRILRRPDLSLEYVGLDVKNVPAFSNPLVWQAVKYALDYKGVTQQLLSGNAILNQGIVPKGMPGYDPDLPFAQDVAKARSLLQQAGYGSGFSADMLIPTGDISGIPASDLASKIKSDLARVGITVNIRQLQASQLYTTYRAQQAQMVLANWSADYPDPDDFAKPFGDYSQKSLAWRLNWDDPSLAQLVDKAGTLPSGPERDGLYRQINQNEMMRGPFAILYQPLQSYATTSHLRSVYINPIFGIDLLNVTKG